MPHLLTDSFRSFIVILFLVSSIISGAARRLPASERTESLAAAIKNLNPAIFSDEQRKEFDNAIWQDIRRRRDQANATDIAQWRKIETREQWEEFRDVRIARLRRALAQFPEPPKNLQVRVTGKVEGDGFVIENVVYQTRPDFWVTANLYVPQRQPKSMPGIIIVSSHHRPKTQGELQDMGMTWARAGCQVLVIDQVGYGERAAHPFRSADDYDGDYQWWRQDYYFRYDHGAQLHLLGDSLMGWFAWDLMRGVDLLLARPGIDQKRIIILGGVAGGGDPCGVAAALDERIAAAVPFNFGGPQPETRYPLPDDAETSFNYMGGAYWDTARNLRRTGPDGFFHWVIVGSLAPRGLVYGHEFAWDQERDPVFKRFEKLWGYYDAPDKLAFAHGRGSLKGRPPESTHCGNIGQYHRKLIHAAFAKWFDIQVTEDDEYSKRRENDELMCWTSAARAELKPIGLTEAMGREADRRLSVAKKKLDEMQGKARRDYLGTQLANLLGPIDPKSPTATSVGEPKHDEDMAVERIVLKTEPGFTTPALVLRPAKPKQKRLPTVVVVAQSGKETILKERATDLAKLVEGGTMVVVPDLRGARPSRGSHGSSSSFNVLMFDFTVLGSRLRDLRSVLKYIRTRDDVAPNQIALWGESFAEPNAADTNFQVPRRASGRPRMSEPDGALLVMLGALYEDDVKAVLAGGGLSDYRSVLDQPWVYIPHDVVVPGILTVADIPDIAATLAPLPMRFDRTVDGLNRLHTDKSLSTTAGSATKWLLDQFTEK